MKRLNKILLNIALSLLSFSFSYSTFAALPPAPTNTPIAAQNGITPSSPSYKIEEVLKVGSDAEVIINVQLRLIDLNYFAFKPTGTFGSMTRAAVVDFQEKNGLIADGSIGQETLDELFSNSSAKNPNKKVSAKRNSILSSVTIPIGPTSKAPPILFGNATEWTNVKDIFVVDNTAKIIDLNTSKTFHLKRVGGENHAIVMPATQNDKNIFLEVFGGQYNWSKRPVLVEISNTNVAASLSGDMRDDKTSLYFTGSTSDIANIIDVEHRRTILRATGLDW